MADAAATGSSLRGWDRFWHAPGNTLSFGIFRFLFALALMAEIEVTRDKSPFAIEGGFHDPYISLIKPVPESLYQAMHDLQYPFVILLALGLLPRLSAGVLLGLQGYIFFADRMNFRNHPYFFLLLLLLFIFSPAGKSFSIPALVRRLRKRRAGEPPPGPAVAPLTIQRLMQFQVSVVYLYAALHKMTAYYLDGHVLSRLLAPTLAGVVPAGTRTNFWVASAWATVMLELTLAVALWIPRVRPAAMVFGIVFHLMIGVTMNITVFSAAMVASYLLFLDPDTLPRVSERIRARFTGPPVPVPLTPAPRKAAEATSKPKKGESRRARNR